jgi:GNAT superfamily N-acetyltransferase
VGRSSITVRPATRQDVDRIVSVYTRARHEAMPWLPVQHSHEEDLAHFGDHIVDGVGHRTWVAVRDGRVVGFAALAHGELGHLYVDPDHQGQGVGSALFSHLRQAVPSGFTARVLSGNDRAQRFYEQRDAHPVYASDGAGNDDHLPDVTYRWLPR